MPEPAVGRGRHDARQVSRAARSQRRHKQAGQRSDHPHVRQPPKRIVVAAKPRALRRNEHIGCSRRLQEPRVGSVGAARPRGRRQHHPAREPGQQRQPSPASPPGRQFMRDEPPDSPHGARLRTTGSTSQDASSTAVWRRRAPPCGRAFPYPSWREAECARAARLRADSAWTLKRLSGGAAGASRALDPAPPDRPTRSSSREPTLAVPPRRPWAAAGLAAGQVAPTSGSGPAAPARSALGAEPRDFPVPGARRQTRLHSPRRASPPRLQSAEPVGRGAAGGLSACTRAGAWLAWTGARNDVVPPMLPRGQPPCPPPAGRRDWQVNPGAAPGLSRGWGG